MENLNIKDRCIVCCSLIKNPKTNYIQRGNFCSRCNNRISTKMKLKNKKIKK